MSKIPGFRSGTLWKKIVACIGYFFISTSVVGALASSSTPRPESAQTKSTVTTTEVIACEKKKVGDSTLEEGREVSRQECKNGSKELVWEVTQVGGKETKRTKSSEKTTAEPAVEIIAVGTKVDAATPTPATASSPAPKPRTTAPKPSSNCDPNYSGCVPIASDVDCSSGSGNGPAYVSGPVNVIGSDIYRLDSDGDGTGCE